VSEIRCPECNCLLKNKDLDNDKCWKCGMSPIRELIEKKQNITISTKSESKEQKRKEKEQKRREKEQLLENRTLSEKYSFLRIFQLVIGFSMSYIIFILIDYGLLETYKEEIVFPLILSIFSSVCVILIVEFIFELDKQKSDKE
jgi:TPP-dependent indolepyruvate ferredoxin oxidoreductase alpha subunit